MSADNERQLIQTAESVSREVLFRWADDVDRQGRFPRESIEALGAAGYLAYFVPRRLGGLEGDVQTFWRLAALFGEGCLSTALIWAMHCQQVAVLADHAADVFADQLISVARDGALVASVTSEEGKGGDLLTAVCALTAEADRLRLQRYAPTVSYGAQAGLFLITARASPDRPPNDVRLVLATPSDGTLRVAGEWQAMGMRGTCSVPMRFDLTLAPSRVLQPPFRHMALQTMIPIGHLGWAGAWFGAARGACNRFVQRLRSPTDPARRKLHSDLFTHRLARLRLSLDLLEALLQRVAAHLDLLRRQEAAIQEYQQISYTIALNNLKLAGSELSFAIIDGLVELAGLQQGYLQEQSLGLERTFRDLRAAALMFHNDRLLEANGKLLLVETGAMQAAWQSQVR